MPKINKPEKTEVHLVENFQLEFESDASSVLRWYKQTQPRHEDYIFRITIETIPKDKK